MQPMRGSSIILRVVCLAISLVAAACAGADDSADQEAPSIPNETEAEASLDQTETTPPPDPGPSVTQEQPAVPGISDDAVRLGILLLDLDRLAGIGVSGEAGDVEAVWQALVDRTNDAGGVNGRVIEPVFHRLLPTPDESEAACLRLAEDEEVFAVTGPILPEGVLCFTALHQTPFISPWILTEEQFQRSIAPVAAVGPSAERLLRGLARLLDEEGMINDHRFAVVGRADNESQVEVMIEALSSAGALVVDDAVLEAERFDQLALDAALDVAVERWRVNDADTVVVVGGLSTAAALALDRSGFDATLILTSGEGIEASTYTDVGIALDVLDGALGVGGAPDLVAYEQNPRLQECIDEAASTSSEVVIELADTDGALSELRAATEACQAFELFVAAATAAGDHLNIDTFREGLDSLGTVELPGLTGSAGPGKHDISDEFWLYRFDGNAGEFVPTGEPLVAIDP